MTDKEIKTIKLLNQNWQLLSKSIDTLKKSVQKAKAIGQKKEYSFEEMETFDSLTSKFGRSSDIFTQKILRSIWMLLHEDSVPFIDLLNKAEKMSLIQSSNILIEIRDLRNQIAHEYIAEAIQELIPEVINLVYELEKNIQVTYNFIKKRKWLSTEP